MATKSAHVTHFHPDGIAGEIAVAVAAAVASITRASHQMKLLRQSGMLSWTSPPMARSVFVSRFRIVTHSLETRKLPELLEMLFGEVVKLRLSGWSHQNPIQGLSIKKVVRQSSSVIRNPSANISHRVIRCHLTSFDDFCHLQPQPRVRLFPEAGCGCTCPLQEIMKTHSEKQFVEWAKAHGMGFDDLSSQPPSSVGPWVRISTLCLTTLGTS